MHRNRRQNTAVFFKRRGHKYTQGSRVHKLLYIHMRRTEYKSRHNDGGRHGHDLFHFIVNYAAEQNLLHYGSKHRNVHKVKHRVRALHHTFKLFAHRILGKHGENRIQNRYQYYCRELPAYAANRKSSEGGGVKRPKLYLPCKALFAHLEKQSVAHNAYNGAYRSRKP